MRQKVRSATSRGPCQQMQPEGVPTKFSASAAVPVGIGKGMHQKEGHAMSRGPCQRLRPQGIPTMSPESKTCAARSAYH
eukprot:1152288-Pelagomonas_calceolata.AAC.8